MGKNVWSLIGIVAAAPLAAQTAANEYHPPAKRISPQDGLVAQVIPKGPTPRMADGHPDLSGNWGGDPRWDSPYNGYHPRSLAKLEPDQAALQRSSTSWNRPIYKPELWQKVYDADYGKIVDDPAFRCVPKGVPRMGMPQKIVEVPREVVLVNGEQVRFVPTDGRARDPIDSDYENYNGVPLGHWEGDTLVIESIGFNDKTWFGWTGYIHSDKMKVIERLSRKGDVLYYQFTVDDPDMLVQPWTSETFIRRLNTNPNYRMEEVAPCQENDADQVADPYFRG